MVLGITVNWWAILVAAVANIIVGYLWYGPFFGKKWKELSGMKSQKMSSVKMTPAKSYLFGFIAALVMAYVLALFAQLAFADTFVRGALVGFWVWLGFVATVTIGSVIWE